MFSKEDREALDRISDIARKNELDDGKMFNILVDVFALNVDSVEHLIEKYSEIKATIFEVPYGKT